MILVIYTIPKLKKDPLNQQLTVFFRDDYLTSRCYDVSAPTDRISVVRFAR